MTNTLNNGTEILTTERCDWGKSCRRTPQYVVASFAIGEPDLCMERRPLCARHAADHIESCESVEIPVELHSLELDEDEAQAAEAEIWDEISARYHDLDDPSSGYGPQAFPS